MVLLVESHQGGKEVVGTSALHSSYKTYEALAHSASFTQILAQISLRVPGHQVISARMRLPKLCKYYLKSWYLVGYQC